MFDPDKAQGKNTYYPDCSDTSAAPWGFDTFYTGTIGQAILAWIMNTWDEIDCSVGGSLENVVLEEFDFYINNVEISIALRDAWLRDYKKLLQVSFEKYKSTDVRNAGFRLMVYESIVKAWLRDQIKQFLEN